MKRGSIVRAISAIFLCFSTLQVRRGGEKRKKKERKKKKGGSIKRYI